MSRNKKLVFVCSPFGGKEENLEFARIVCRDIMINCEKIVPIAPHLFFPGFLDEHNSIERTFGIVAGLEILRRCDEMWVFAGHGISKGMGIEIEEAKKIGVKIKYFYKWPIDISMGLLDKDEKNL